MEVRTFPFSSLTLFLFEVRVVAEAREVVKHLEGLLGGEDEVLVKMDDFFDLPCLNVMWSLVASGRFSLDIFASPKMIHSIID